MGNGDALAFGCSTKAAPALQSPLKALATGTAAVYAGCCCRRRRCFNLGTRDIWGIGDWGTGSMDYGVGRSSSPLAADTGVASMAWHATHLDQAAALCTGRLASRAGRTGNSGGDGRGSECRREHEHGRAMRCGSRREAVSA